MTVRHWFLILKCLCLMWIIVKSGICDSLWNFKKLNDFLQRKSRDLFLRGLKFPYVEPGKYLKSPLLVFTMTKRNLFYSLGFSLFLRIYLAWYLTLTHCRKYTFDSPCLTILPVSKTRFIALQVVKVPKNMENSRCS